MQIIWFAWIVLEMAIFLGLVLDIFVTSAQYESASAHESVTSAQNEIANAHNDMTSVQQKISSIYSANELITYGYYGVS